MIHCCTKVKKRYIYYKQIWLAIEQFPIYSIKLRTILKIQSQNDLSVMNQKCRGANRAPGRPAGAPVSRIRSAAEALPDWELLVLRGIP